MQKWEYLQVSTFRTGNKIESITVNGEETPFNKGLPDFFEYINKLGIEGWEMINSSSTTYLFKRPIE